MIITKTAVQKWNAKTKAHYVEKGYTFTNFKDEFDVKIEDLTKGSNVKIEVECDYCKKIIPNLSYKTYLAQREKSDIKKDCCKPCSKEKISESNMLKYGVTNIMHVKEVKEKQEQIILEKYGVTNISKLDSTKEKKKESSLKNYGAEHYSKTDEFKKRVKKTSLKKYGATNYTKTKDYLKKTRETSLERYGVEHHLKSEEIISKREKTNVEKYGKPNVFQNKKIQEKSKESMIKRYGVEHYSKTKEYKNEMAKFWTKSKKNGDIRTIVERRELTNLKKYGFRHPLQNPTIAEKMRKTLSENGNVPTSKQQKHIHSILGGELNFAVGHSSLDIAFPERKIYFEYDGGGHNLNVKLGKLSEEEFDKKEKRRYFYLLDNGWNCIRLICPNDKLPTDEEILSFLEYCLFKFDVEPLLSSIKWYSEDGIFKESYRREEREL